eukprot:4425495-Prorocentrum_lima.AAC.1
MPSCDKPSSRCVHLLKQKVSFVDAQQLLTEAVKAKNCLTTIGQYTPIRPALLPDAGRGEAHCDDSLDDGFPLWTSTTRNCGTRHGCYHCC